MPCMIPLTVKKGIGTAVLWFAALVQIQSSMADEVLVAVASNFSVPMAELVQQFEQQTDHEINVVYGSSGRLYAQILNGAPFQIFLSADQDKPQQLEANQLIVPGSRFTYASGVLVLWSAEQDREIDGPDALERSFNRLAIANPELAPYGKAASEVLHALGVTANPENKTVRGENIAQTYQFVETRNAELGLVALSQVGTADGVSRGAGWIIPEHLHEPILQDAVLLRSATNCNACQQFYQFIKSDDAAKTIASYGYRMP